MENLLKFIKENYIILIAGVLFYGLFVFYSVNGNRICDCESTENYKPTHTGRTSINHFYHK